MESTATWTPIAKIQGNNLESPLADQEVTTRGVVTGSTRKGFFIQDPRRHEDPTVSTAVFVFRLGSKPRRGTVAQVTGKVVNFVARDNDRPTTQVLGDEIEVVSEEGREIAPIWLNADNLPRDGLELARFLNGLEGMLVGIGAGATFIAPSNPFGDYVVLPDGMEGVRRTEHGGVLIDPEVPDRWFPGFRILDYARAPQLNVGAKLLLPVVGPLNYRAASYQVAAQDTIAIRDQPITLETSSLTADDAKITVMTLNSFNLDPKVEDAALVNDPNRDIDDDVGNGRFKKLAEAVVEQAGAPDILALQEIQDSDGAEQSGNVDASETYRHLIKAIQEVGGPVYEAADVPPVAGADGGQPGGNIRNGFLFDPARVELIAGTLHERGRGEAAFEDSRKVLVGHFRKRASGQRLALINVHLASKRQQYSLFAPIDPGHDPRLERRVQQAQAIREYLLELREQGTSYYVTGDFNDFEFSDTLRELCGTESVNLVETLPLADRYDYNHRGLSQVLMHGIVSSEEAEAGRIEYEILHGNELLGTRPGDLGDKPTDHAYVLAAFAGS